MTTVHLFYVYCVVCFYKYSMRENLPRERCSEKSFNSELMINGTQCRTYSNTALAQFYETESHLITLPEGTLFTNASKPFSTDDSTCVTIDRFDVRSLLLDEAPFVKDKISPGTGDDHGREENHISNENQNSSSFKSNIDTVLFEQWDLPNRKGCDRICDPEDDFSVQDLGHGDDKGENLAKELFFERFGRYSQDLDDVSGSSMKHSMQTGSIEDVKHLDSSLFLSSKIPAHHKKSSPNFLWKLDDTRFLSEMPNELLSKLPENIPKRQYEIMKKTARRVTDSLLSSSFTNAEQFEILLRLKTATNQSNHPTSNNTIDIKNEFDFLDHSNNLFPLYQYMKEQFFSKEENSEKIEDNKNIMKNEKQESTVLNGLLDAYESSSCSESENEIENKDRNQAEATLPNTNDNVGRDSSILDRIKELRAKRQKVAAESEPHLERNVKGRRLEKAKSLQKHFLNRMANPP